MAIRNGRDIEMAIAGLNAIKLAYETYASSTDAQEIVMRTCKALECYGQIGKYLAEGIRQDGMAPAHHTAPIQAT